MDDGVAGPRLATGRVLAQYDPDVVKSDGVS